MTGRAPALLAALGILVACGGATQVGAGEEAPIVIPSAIPTASAPVARDAPVAAPDPVAGAPDAAAPPASDGERDVSASAAAPGVTGLKECDDYIRKAGACIAKQNATMRAAMEPGFYAQRDMFELSAAAATTPETRRAIKKSCGQALAALGKNPMCK